MPEDQQNLNTAEEQSISDGGFFVMMQKPGSNVELRVLPASAVEETMTKAATALQPETTGDMVNEDAAGFVRVEDYDSMIAFKDAQISDLYQRISSIESTIGIESLVVFETDVFESGVFAG